MADKQHTPNPSARQVLLDLADRCEWEEPSRDLDLAILNAVDASPHEWLWRAGYDTITRLDYGEGAPGNPVCSLDAYTTSLDAAVTLVPECGWWRVGVASATSAGIYTDAAGEVEGNGRTPALALCAASLRARAEAL